MASDGATTVDLNRAGSTLVEIVTAPDLRGAEEAASAAETFQRVVRFLGVGDANMEEGSMRVDVNVSHRTRDGAVVGERCEVTAKPEPTHRQRCPPTRPPHSATPVATSSLVTGCNSQHAAASAPRLGRSRFRK